MRYLLFLLLSAVLSKPVHAQTDEITRKLQIAQRLEQAGDWAQASVLYENLWRSDTTNYVFFDALRRAYGRLKQYDKAIALIEHRMRMRPAEGYLAAYLGGVLFDAGRRGQADDAWQEMLTAQPKQRQLYALVAQVMQERRLFGRAIETYKQGRLALAKEAEFAQELALLHSATQAYGDAVAEYLLLLEQTPHQLGYIQSRIASFTIRDEGLRQAESVVATAVARRPGNIQFRSLHAWVLMEQGRFAEALQAYRALDSMSASKGAQVFRFAEMASRQGHYAEAAQAYGDIMLMTPASSLRPRAMYGIAQTYEQRLSARADFLPSRRGPGTPVPEIVQPSDSALLFYGRVIEEYPGSEPAIQSLFRIGIIRYERLFDLDGALRAFEGIRNDPRAGSLAWEALLMATEIHLAKGDVPGARALLQGAPTPARAYLQDRFTLQSAWIAYFLGEFEQAQRVLQETIRSLTLDGANDGLSLYYHLQEGMADSSTLALFARAELLTRRRQFAEALEYYRLVSEKARTATLVSRSRIASADMLVMTGRTPEAIQLLDSLVSTQQTDVLRDRALFRLGTLYDHELGNVERARETYEKFLILFPTSILADEVRQRARSLRKDQL